jgi:hypothetical protein
MPTRKKDASGALCRTFRNCYELLIRRESRSRSVASESEVELDFRDRLPPKSEADCLLQQQLVLAAVV